MERQPVKLTDLTSNESSKFILEVASKAVLKLDSENHIKIQMHQIIPTVVETFLQVALKEAAAVASSTNKDALINMFDMFKIGYVVDEDDESEKGGNIVPGFVPLGYMKTTGKDDETQTGE